MRWVELGVIEVTEGGDLVYAALTCGLELMEVRKGGI